MNEHYRWKVLRKNGTYGSNQEMIAGAAEENLDRRGSGVVSRCRSTNQRLLRLKAETPNGGWAPPDDL